MFAGRKLHNEFLDECRNVLVGDHLAFPFLHIKSRWIHFDLKIGFYFHLASESPVVFDLFAREVYGLCGENVAASRNYLQLALSATALAAACTRKMHSVVVERGKK